MNLGAGLPSGIGQSRSVESKSLPSVEDGWVLTRTFLSIRDPERRQSVLRYAARQARMDEKTKKPPS